MPDWVCLCRWTALYQYTGVSIGPLVKAATGVPMLKGSSSDGQCLSVSQELYTGALSSCCGPK